MPTQHDKLWFNDGNVVLSANETLFRVHKSVLALQSSFFDGLFTLPTPNPGGVTNSTNNSQDSYDGLPVVRMVDDDAEDVECLVQVMYNPWLRTARARLPLPTVMSLIRISTKYDFMRLQAEIIEFLQTIFPHDIHAIKPEDVRSFIGPSSHSMDDENPEICGTIQLLSLLRVMGSIANHITPILFYYSCMEDVALICDVGKRLLSVDDLIRLVVGREHLHKVISMPHGRLDNPVHPRCICEGVPSHIDMGTFRALRWVEKLNIWPENELGIGPDEHNTYSQMDLIVTGSDVFNTQALRDDGICPFCRETMADLYDERRESIWKRLPLIFGLCDEESLGSWYATPTEDTAMEGSN